MGGGLGPGPPAPERGSFPRSFWPPRILLIPQVFINPLFRVEEVAIAQQNKHVGNHGDLGISVLGRNDLGLIRLSKSLVQGRIDATEKL